MKDWIKDMKTWLVIVWSIFLVALAVWVLPYIVPCKSHMNVNDYIIHNPKYVQTLLKNYDIKFYKKLHCCYGKTDEGTKKISVMARKDVLLEQNTFGHEIGHVVANNLHLSKDKKMQKLWHEYGQSLLEEIESDNPEGVEYHSSTIDEGLAQTYVYYLYHLKSDNKFYKYYTAVLDAKTNDFSDVAYK